jgi:GTP-binding protein
MGLEDALEYIGDDELVEVTPENVRIRKRVLDPQAARRQALGIKT